MDIAFVNRPLGMRRGGGEIWDIEMAKQLDEMGHKITMYTGRPLLQDISKPIDLAIEKVPSPFLFDLGYRAPPGIGGAITDIDRQLFIHQLSRHLKDRHDIVHFNGFPELLRLQPSISGHTTMKLNGPPHSLFYDYVHPTKSSYYWLEKADQVITTGVTTSVVEKRTEINPIGINPGVDTERFRPHGEQEETTGPTVLWVGRFVPAKDLPVLIEAFVDVLKEYPKANLWLIGEGPKKNAIQSMAKSEGIHDNTVFWGYIDNNNLEEYYRASDVFALSSKTENHPIALMEAMSCGRPVVAPSIGWIPNMVDDRKDGILIPPENPNALSDAILACIEDKQQMGTRARQKAERQFSWEERANKLLETFYSISG